MASKSFSRVLSACKPRFLSAKDTPAISPLSFAATAHHGKQYSVKEGRTQNGLSVQQKRSFSTEYTPETPKVRGIEILRDPRLNKGTGFTLKERQIIGIHGLLPPCVFSQEEQAKRVIDNVHHWDNDLDKYIYLTALQDRNEKLFYKVLTNNVEELAPIVYTPTVGLACQRYGFIYRRPRGLYITINDIGHVYNLLCNWPDRIVKAVVLTDGERILGLGDLGAFGMGIPVGKLSLYTAMGGVPPEQCLPVVLDVGTDNESLLDDPMYIGLRHKRVRGQLYDDIIDEFLQAVVKRFGQSTLIQFEDFANQNAFRLLSKYRDQYLTFNDDIQGTASVVVAGVISSCRITKKRLSQQKYLFLGAGSAAIGIADLLCMAMIQEGLTEEEAQKQIWMVDIDGLLTIGRPGRGMNRQQAKYAKDFEHMTNLEEISRAVKPNVALGASAAAGAFTETFIHDLASFNERPVIFALSNPTSKAECTAEQAYKFSDGRAVFASGSPFAPVTYNGQTFYPGQGNNSYIFPGVALGAIVAESYHITDSVFLIAAQALAEMVEEKHLQEGRLYPPLSDIYNVSTKLAAKVVEHVYNQEMAGTYPEPKDKLAFVRQHQYFSEYDRLVPVTYSWPGMQTEYDI